MLTRWRPWYEKTTIPLGKASLKIGMLPDYWTLLSLVMGGLSGYSLWQHNYWLGLLFLLLMNVTDMLDGATARAGNMASAFGMVLDHSLDRYGEFLIFGGLLLGTAISPELFLFTSTGVVMASYVRAKAESVGVKSCNVGLAGRQEKLILTIIGLVLFGIGMNFPAQVSIFLAGLISHITYIQRLLFARREILGSRS